MKTEIEHLENHQVKLKIFAEIEQLESAKRRAARKMAAKTKIPGFRPGKAPYQVVLRQIGEPAILEEALEQLAQELYPQALDETQIDPYGPGSIEKIESIDPPILSFVIPLAAKVTLGDYKSIRIPYTPAAIASEEVDQYLENLRQQNAVIEPVDRPAMEGDQLLIVLDGKRQNPEEGQETILVAERKYPAVIDSETEDTTNEWPFPGFSRQLIGLSIGDEIVLSHTFSDDFPYESLRGVAAEFKATVESISSRRLPALDDDFAKTTNEADSLEDLREKITASFLSDKTSQVEREFNNQIIEKILETAEIKYPAQMLDSETEDLVHEFGHRLENQGLDLETYLRIMKKSDEEWKAEMREQARKRLERSLVVFQVSKEESINVSEAELQEETIRTLDALSSSLSESDKRKLGDRNVLNNLVNNIMGDLVTTKTYERLRAIAQGLEISDQPQENDALAESVQDEIGAASETEPAPESEPDQQETEN